MNTDTVLVENEVKYMVTPGGKKIKSLVGLKYGLWTVDSYAYTKSYTVYWKLICQCGSIAYSCSYKLNSERFKLCCGCLSYYKEANELVGQKFNRLTVIKQLSKVEVRKLGKKKGQRYFLCKCDCGKETVLAYTRLAGKNNRRKTKSCGCGRAVRSGLETDRVFATYKQMYSQFKKRARIYDLELKSCITREQFVHLISRPCFYCGTIGSNLAKDRNHRAVLYPNLRENNDPPIELAYNGIDRLDSSLGYNLDNCVSCCKNCNFAKRLMSVQEFYLWVKILFENLQNTGRIS